MNFPNNHKYHKIFSKNNLKISYSYMGSIKSIFNLHNKEEITGKKTQPINCICIKNLAAPFQPMSNCKHNT